MQFIDLSDKQIGWMGEFGEQLDLPLTGQTKAICQHTGVTYTLDGTQVSTSVLESSQ